MFLCVCVCIEDPALKWIIPKSVQVLVCRVFGLHLVGVCSCVYSTCVQLCVHVAFVWFCMSERSLLAQLDTSAADSHTHITNKWQMMEHITLSLSLCVCVCVLNMYWRPTSQVNCPKICLSSERGRASFHRTNFIYYVNVHILYLHIAQCTKWLFLFM